MLQITGKTNEGKESLRKSKKIPKISLFCIHSSFVIDNS